MPATQPQVGSITLAQYEALPEDKRVEVFDGVIYDMASPSQIHQTILTELLVIIRNYIKSKNGSCSVFPAPFDVKLSDKPLTIVQPDIMVICDKDGKNELEILISLLKLFLLVTLQMIISVSYTTTKIMEYVNTGLQIQREKLFQ